MCYEKKGIDMVKIGFKSDRGAVRNNNEDSCFVMPKEQFYMVADGVGGNNAGEEASSIAVATIAEYIKANPLKKPKSDDEVCMYMNTCVEIANKKIIEHAAQKNENRGMATTIVMCHIRENKAFFANAGDSRAYIYRKGKLCQITEDHSYVNKLLKGGAISQEEAENHERRNMITKALGAEEKVNGDFYYAEILDGDKILLCTDGLYGELSQEEMMSILDSEGDMLVLTEKLKNRANENGGHDNITVVCLDIEGGCHYE